MINMNVIKKAMFLPVTLTERRALSQKKAKLLLRMPSRQIIFRVHAYLL